MLHRKCTFLDPRYRDLLLTDIQIKDDIKRGVINEIVAFKLSNNTAHTEEKIVGESNAIQPTSFWDFIKRRRTGTEETATFSLENEVKQELIRYLSLPEIDPWDDPLLWWRANTTKLPLLSLMARRYLSIPSTSVESERLFSNAGDIVTEKRSSLSPDNVAQLLFLHKNLNRKA